MINHTQKHIPVCRLNMSQSVSVVLCLHPLNARSEMKEKDTAVTNVLQKMLNIFAAAHKSEVIPSSRCGLLSYNLPDDVTAAVAHSLLTKLSLHVYGL